MTNRSHHPPKWLRYRWPQRLAALFIASGIVHGQTAAIAQLQTPLVNQAAYEYSDPVSGNQFQGRSSNISTQPKPLVDPLGQILACNGTQVPNYAGFSVAIYEADATGLEPVGLLPLTRTEFPDDPGNTIPGGKAPNIENRNPFFLTNRDQGRYNFLFDPNQGQTQPGKTYILVVEPPSNSEYLERRIQIEILQSTGGANSSIVRYRAAALDGQPLTVQGGNQVDDNVVEVFDAESGILNLFSLALSTIICENRQIQITKSGDRAAAQPGDTAVYRIAVRNLIDVSLDNVVATDILPFGFRFLSESVRGQIDGVPVQIEAQLSPDGATVTFKAGSPIPAGQVLNIVYATHITPDAVRGSARNSAVVDAERVDNGFDVKDGPVSHLMRLDQGILNDCGTLIGRVFVDKNFDGEQQPGEPGVPNAVVFLDDGNRIVTDANGLYSVSNMLPGYRSGALDLSSLPGYSLAPNLYFRERNSQSRLVHLAPGAMVRMNFAVTPTFQEEDPS
ncbi:MAG: DUF11 domain-containing protein [Leptolyngbyaceae cyanobacterium SM1_1_3]|nr:DUF11 domain-containing protein [Leptolyngbyaceae cyanobacterium SM1_1_3]NJN04175.1 DUF11 domain-containing protein [Leptolyngbyaceae cyanobacterium RM1_1_2]NJO08616.1 DUF11 domain-containing protein [Leptolyngbyaceae cyanobacterium SL_1_1]